jgi:hypothetical protein
MSWEGRLESRTTRLTLERLDKCRLFSANIGAGSTMDIDVEVIATSAGVLAEESSLVGFIDCLLQLKSLVPELTSNVDVSGLGTHGEPNTESALYELVWIVTQYLSILASTRL